MIVREPLTVLSLVAAALAAPALSGAEPAPLVLEPRGGTFQGLHDGNAFPSEILLRGPGETTVLRGLGSGVRRQLMFKVYEAALYADGSADLGPDRFRALIHGGFPRHIVLRFMRDVTGAKVREAIEEGFARSVPDGSPALRRDRERLLGYFERGIREGETIELTLLPGRGLYTRIGGEWMEPIDNDPLLRAIMEVWLGENPVSRELKHALVRLADGS